MDGLITGYRFELEEDHHSFGSGRYGVVVKLTNDISAVMPYLNAILKETRYDDENHILIGRSGNKRYAFRPHEIRAPMVPDPSDAPRVAEEVVELVNETWEKRDEIEPSYREWALPNVYDIFKCLPKTNCRECGCATCLAFAARLRNGEATVEQCPLLLKIEYESNRCEIEGLFPARKG
jgi:ArsR family metal-binding transcriptional regulator